MSQGSTIFYHTCGFCLTSLSSLSAAIVVAIGAVSRFPSRHHHRRHHRRRRCLPSTFVAARRRRHRRRRRLSPSSSLSLYPVAPYPVAPLPVTLSPSSLSLPSSSSSSSSLLNLLYERTLGKPTIGQLADNQQREFKFPNEGFFPMTRGRFPSNISRLDSHK
jgi:hypothetical protein